MPSSTTNVWSGGARTYSGIEDVLLVVVTEVEAEETDTMSEALAKLMTDGRTVDGGTGVPAGTKYVGGGEE